MTIVPSWKEVKRMRKRSLALGVIIVAIVMFALVAVPALQAKPEAEIPFVGMSMVYYANTFYVDFYARSVNVLKYYENDSVLIKDGIEYYTVDVTTRTVTWATGWFADVGYVGQAVELWIPTDVKIGSLVAIGGAQVEVVGSRMLSVQGRDVQCWQLYRAWTENGAYMEDTWYYEETTGLWIGASWIQFDGENGKVIHHWAGYLASTNVPL